MTRTTSDPHDRAYRAGNEGRALRGALMREAESDESVFEAWREGRADREGGQVDDDGFFDPTIDPAPTSRSRSTSSPASSSTDTPTVIDQDRPTAADIARQNRQNDAADRPVPTRTGPTPTAPSFGTPTAAQVTGGARRLFTGQGPGRGKGNIAGFVLGFGLVAIALNMLENGPAAGWQWVKAKFVNQVVSTTAATGATANSSPASTTNLLSGFTSSLDAVSTIAPGSPSPGVTTPNATPVAATPAPANTAVLV